MLWVGRGWADARRAFGRAGPLLCLVLLASGAAEVLARHPHHLMFFNAWAGGPANGPRYLIHRLDWGQDKRRLGRWLRAHGVKRVYYAPYGGEPAQWGIHHEPVPCEPTLGVYALHAVHVHRPTLNLKPGCVDWLTVEEPDERIGYSIYVYRVNAERLLRLRKARNTMKPFWRSGPSPAPGRAQSTFLGESELSGLRALVHRALRRADADLPGATCPPEVRALRSTMGLSSESSTPVLWIPGLG
jgi:hypothetical protein